MKREEKKRLLGHGLIKVGLGLVTIPFNFLAGGIVLYSGLNDLSTIDNNGHRENLSSRISESVADVVKDFWNLIGVDKDHPSDL